MLSVTRYSIKNVRLKPWVKFIWYFETKSNILLNNKLLPTDSIDTVSYTHLTLPTNREV